MWSTFKQRSHWYILWLPFGYLILSFCNYFMCISFLVDIYHHDCHLPRILYTWDKLNIQLISFLSRPPIHSLVICLVALWKFCLECGSISLHFVALFGGEDCFPHACLDEAFAILVFFLLTRLLFSIFTIGHHKFGS